MDKFGSPTSYQIFPSILRMRCVKGQQPSRGHQEITAAIHYEATARDLIPKISFISKDQFQIPPPQILAPPPKTLKLFPRWYPVRAGGGGLGFTSFFRLRNFVLDKF